MTSPVPELLDVDPGSLLEFAASAESTAAVIRNTGVLDALLMTAGAIPGSATEYALRTTVDAVRLPMGELANAFTALSQTVQNAAGEFETIDSVLAEQLNRIEAPQ